MLVPPRGDSKEVVYNRVKSGICNKASIDDMTRTHVDTAPSLFIYLASNSATVY
jgi:hypothetical protein